MSQSLETYVRNCMEEDEASVMDFHMRAVRKPGYIEMMMRKMGNENESLAFVVMGDSIILPEYQDAFTRG